MAYDVDKLEIGIVEKAHDLVGGPNEPVDGPHSPSGSHALQERGFLCGKRKIPIGPEPGDTGDHDPSGWIQITHQPTGQLESEAQEVVVERLAGALLGIRLDELPGNPGLVREDHPRDDLGAKFSIGGLKLGREKLSPKVASEPIEFSGADQA
ncbi:MAG TPA: hypothetical protein VGS22_29765 [Thermoanaerobaculia bacterium]|nr:hypothetical protein [Thermoanaerobaculia bacterium]